MHFTLHEMIEKGMLRRIPSSSEKAIESIRTSEQWLKESEQTFKAKSFRSSLLTSYLALFHVSRAVLFADGFREKSHVAVVRYLEEVYASKGKLELKWIETLDYYRELRHSDQYSTAFIISEKEAKDALVVSREFHERIKLFLSKEKGIKE